MKITATESSADVLLNACKDIGLPVNLGKIVHGSRTSLGHDDK